MGDSVPLHGPAARYYARPRADVAVDLRKGIVPPITWENTFSLWLPVGNRWVTTGMT